MSLEQLEWEVKTGESRKGNIFVKVLKLLWQQTGMQTSGCPQMLWADISAHRDQTWLWVAESDLRSASYILSVRKYLLNQGCTVSYICS